MIGLLGLDYRQTTSELRGRLSFSGDRLDAALRTLLGSPSLDEVVVLSTCNRTEIYAVGAEWSAAATAIRHFVGEVAGERPSPVTSALTECQSQTSRAIDAQLLPAAAATAHPASGERELWDVLYEREGIPAAEHLLRVAVGLQSMVVGEAQILGQVKDALAAAEVAGAVGEELRTLFDSAVKVGKRARAETELGRADISVASVAVRVAGEALGGLEGRNALVVGAGRTSQLCARLLRDSGIGQLTLANRTIELAAELADAVEGRVVALADVVHVITEADLIISATAAPHHVLRAETLAQGMAGRHQPLVIVDLAVPPDIEPAVALLPAVSLYTLDTLRGLAGEALEGEARSTVTLAQVEEIVTEGLHEYVRSRTLRLAVPSIASLRRHVDRSERAELARALADLGHLSDHDRAIVARFGQRLVDKMFHHLVLRIRALAEYDEVHPDVTMRVLAQLFTDPSNDKTDPSASPTSE